MQIRPRFIVAQELLFYRLILLLAVNYGLRTAIEITAGITPTNYFYSPEPLTDPRRYGLTADGSTNDSTALQSALDVLESQKGGTIVFRPVRFI